MNKIYLHTKRESASLTQNFKYSRSGVRVYLDYAATTPIDPLIKKAMAPYFNKKFGNPSSLHSFGQEAIAAIDESREKIAKTINANFREIIFTSSATEANNLALRGAIETFKRRQSATPRIIVSSIEHECILETAKDLEREGAEIIYLPVNREGIVDLKELKRSLNNQTVLVSVMSVNNVIGTVEPIKEISEIIKNFKGDRTYPLFHTDAVQAFPYFDCDAKNIPVDLMVISSHKINGPKGAGMLYAREPKLISPIITGGGQEFGLRSGTENVPAIVGFGKAVELTAKTRESELKRLIAIKNYFLKNLRKIYPQMNVNSPEKPCSPHIVNVSFPNHSSQDMLIKLDLAGIAASSGSACLTRAMKSSYALKAIGCDEKRIKNSLRFSFGKFTTKNEIYRALKIIKNFLK